MESRGELVSRKTRSNPVIGELWMHFDGRSEGKWGEFSIIVVTILICILIIGTSFLFAPFYDNTNSRLQAT